MRSAVKPLLLAVMLALHGCGSSSDSNQAGPVDNGRSADTGGAATGSGSGSSGSGGSSSGGDGSSAAQGPWVLNDGSQRSRFILEQNTGLGVLVNVQSVSTESTNSGDFTRVIASGIPDYQVLATADLIAALNSRPKAGSDFNGGSVSISEGEVIDFGQDIGFASNNSCETNAGYGYWPPGPVCPEELDRDAYLPQQPEETDEDCETGLGVIGLWVNGTSVYNWGDGQSYSNQGTWYNLAPIAEQYDVDICGGHAAQGDYHHHFYSSCLADMVDDAGNGHSPIYGYAADGYPIYGPWFEDGQLAISAWVTRDYSADSTTGCGVDNQRSCTLVDPYDVSRGVQSASRGPDVGAAVTTLSRNTLEAYSGYYHEDYYWDAALTAQGGAYLDQYNGHDHDDLGYHYHVTVTEEGGKLTPAYPFIIGDRFAGKLQDNSLAQCSAGAGRPF
ncbi:YHYH protein [Aliiglaciecola sp. CAU 1673]|uniref:YHYH protein n=1 Tax=Aliiglaciecola sp. CAU 1673 TaxID=3032595 RepID=UPI0023DA3FF5|nr:YHYH protein [Aliiglaciecola sp. CAU 1673]MDF2180251.1 YHYH protein [Aliiglaciecola sp. CAU 1673]